MAKGSSFSSASISSSSAPRIGDRVWLLSEGGFGRVVAVCQGGLLCRVQLESGAVLVDRPGCELLRIAEEG